LGLSGAGRLAVSSGVPALRLSIGLILAAGACTPRPQAVPAAAPLAALAVAESAYADARDARDRYDVAIASGGRGDAARVNRLRADLASALASVDSGRLTGQDARALGVMRRALREALDSVAPVSLASEITAPRCPPSAESGLDSLKAQLYRCYGWVQSHLLVGADTLDRLTVLGEIGRSTDPSRRRALFLALDPVWRSLNGGGGGNSPYRRLIALEAAARSRRAGAGDHDAGLDQVRAAGLPPDSLEPWLIAVLEAWRAASADSVLEPWDWWYRNGQASRALSPRIPLPRLLPLDRAVFRALGADVERLGVRFDLAPRDGKDPVASTTFGARAPVIEPWIFATYRDGGLDNLNELLHETGHAIHLAAIRTRPAFRDWPDSDPFTEAVADVVALDVYEPAWQQRWLGDSVPLAESLRGRYGSIVLDVAWALFERRMLREPSADPNEVWTDLTTTYLRIRPHPELSWWAMRGQLIDAPGYMMNYAAGAILIAAIRERIRRQHAPFVAGDPTWYGWVAPRLYRFGLERPTREVVVEFLGGPVTPAALLRDLARMRVTATAGTSSP
jgi:hypothetical protein